MSTIIKIGIIGGTGLADPKILENQLEIPAKQTPYGLPSDNIINGQINGVDCYFLARHGRKHTIQPSQVNYRANVWCLKELGCTHILASSAAGSLSEKICPGDLIILDDFIDYTRKREQTFYDGGTGSSNIIGTLKGINHLQMPPAFCPRTRNLIIKSAKNLNYTNVHECGTAITIEGPRFSSKAESKLFKMFGADIINMTTVPEVILAKELGLCYAVIAIATDYDSWRDCGESVSATAVLKLFKENVNKIIELLKETITNIAKEDWTDTITDLKNRVEQGIMK